MLYFTADPRDGVVQGGICQACCCEPISMRPGETNLLTINYAPWSLPIAPPGIVPSFNYSVDTDCSSCQDEPINGINGPQNENYQIATDPNDSVATDVTATAFPAAGPFTYAIVPLAGPFNGNVEQTAPGVFTYTPRNGFTGWDVYYYTQTDQFGRTITRSVVINVGNALNAPDGRWTSDVPFIDMTAVRTDQNLQIVSFPIYMPLQCRGCELYRLTIRQGAQDCNCSTFFHYKCFDIRCGDC